MVTTLRVKYRTRKEKQKIHLDIYPVYPTELSTMGM
jgi:hypothetical protein